MPQPCRFECLEPRVLFAVSPYIRDVVTNYDASVGWGDGLLETLSPSVALIFEADITVTDTSDAALHRGPSQMHFAIYRDLDSDTWLDPEELAVPTVGPIGLLPLNGPATAHVETLLEPGDYLISFASVSGYDKHANAFEVYKSDGNIAGTLSRPPTLTVGRTRSIYEPPLPIEHGDTTPDPYDGTDFLGMNLHFRGVARVFTLTNDGDAPLNVTGIDLPAGFILYEEWDPTTTLAPGESVDLDVAFRPSAVGEHAGDLVIHSDDPRVPAFRFSVKGVVHSTVGAAYSSFTFPLGDIRPDLVLRRDDTSQTAIFQITDGAAAATHVLAGLPPAWRLAGVGELNGDRHADLIFRHAVTGANIAWLMEGTTRIGSVKLLTLHTTWSLGGVGDFDGDGRGELVWRNRANGSNVMWTLDAQTLAPTAAMMPRLAQTMWQAVGAGDFSNDGLADVLFRHRGTGANVVWAMDGTTRTGTLALPSMSPGIWEVVDVKNLVGPLEFTSGDAWRANVIWRHRTTGRIWEYAYETSGSLQTMRMIDGIDGPWRGPSVNGLPTTAAAASRSRVDAGNDRTRRTELAEDSLLDLEPLVELPTLAA